MKKKRKKKKNLTTYHLDSIEVSFDIDFEDVCMCSLSSVLEKFDLSWTRKLERLQLWSIALGQGYQVRIRFGPVWIHGGMGDPSSIDCVRWNRGSNSVDNKRNQLHSSEVWSVAVGMPFSAQRRRTEGDTLPAGRGWLIAAMLGFIYDRIVVTREHPPIIWMELHDCTSMVDPCCLEDRGMIHE